MTSQITFYLSQILGKKYISDDGTTLGTIKDFLVDQTPLPGKDNEPVRPHVVAIKVKKGADIRILDFSSFEIKKLKRKLRITCLEIHDLSPESFPNSLWLAGNVLNKQIVDIHGRKLVKVNDVRMVLIPAGTYVIAVDVGLEGLLRRFRIDKFIRMLLLPFRFDIPGKYILWDDIEAVGLSNSMLKLSKSSSKLHTLHPSDLADIIEELDKTTQAYLFASLDDEQAADVLEELETHAQIQLVENLPVEKVADVLERMPADEVADLLDALSEDQAAKLLEEMEKETSEEVRELLEYTSKYVGSLMTTDFYTFYEDLKVSEAIAQLRRMQPEPGHINALFITDRKDRFLSVITLGELVLADPDLLLRDIMKKNPVTVLDNDKVDSLAELISKYNLLAVPVLNKDRMMEGVVVVEDIVDDLLSNRKTR